MGNLDSNGGNHVNGNDPAAQLMVGLLIVAAVLAVYFLPTLIAVNRGHRNAGPIFVINLFLAWTFVIWVIVLAWSLSDNTRQKTGP
jgi:Kef-type K+ transport system membrane component KefB